MSIAQLDSAEKFAMSTFTRGDNASGLIYACSYADFLSIDRDRFEIAAVTGNSMGWYTTLACAGALSGEDGFKTVNTMGAIMQAQLIGGQMIYRMCYDASPVFEIGEQVFDLVSDFVGGFEVTICFLSAFWRNARRDSLLGQHFAGLAAVLTAIADPGFGLRHVLEHDTRALEVAALPFAQMQPNGPPRLSYNACSLVFRPPIAGHS